MVHLNIWYLIKAWPIKCLVSPTDENLEQRQNMKMNLDGTKIGLQQKTHQFEVYEKKCYRKMHTVKLWVRGTNEISNAQTHHFIKKLLNDRFIFSFFFVLVIHGNKTDTNTNRCCYFDEHLCGIAMRQLCLLLSIDICLIDTHSSKDFRILQKWRWRDRVTCSTRLSALSLSLTNLFFIAHRLFATRCTFYLAVPFVAS